MPPFREIRADYDRDTLVVYQAYPPAIAKAAVEAGRFVPPFSMQRMTWIKPSFTWMMARSNWATRSGQEHVLAVRIRRDGWESALRDAVLTSYQPGVHPDAETWSAAFSEAIVHVQWDPERSLRGTKLEHRSIQVGISRHRIERFVNDWIVDLEDITPRVHKMRDLLQVGSADRARRLQPPERPYPVPDEVAARLGMRGGSANEAIALGGRET